jgi:predicted nuclease of predicted toxin-antitoxin system
MRFLVDANLSPKVAAGLRDGGHDAVHVYEIDMHSATDEAISLVAAEESRAVISSDSDFAQILALTGRTAPSLVLLRSADPMTPSEQVSLLLANLTTVADDLEAGAVASLGGNHLRVRPLPLRGAKPTKGETIVNRMAGTSTTGWTTDDLMDQLRGE